jgi:DNA mismatch repair protein MutL
VRDLFYATPARLKFLKSDRSESEAIRDVVRRLAMSRPDVAFTMAGEERAPITWAAALPGPPGRLKRLADVLGAEFQANAVEIKGGRDGFSVAGFAALPTLSRANSLGQYLFVNGRPVRDKLLIGVVRGAYADYLPRDRHPLVALFVTLDPRELDVNVHPAKIEVRFRNASLVRALLVHALKAALMREGTRAATTGGTATIAAFRPEQGNYSSFRAGARRGGPDWRRSLARPGDPRRPSAFLPGSGFGEAGQVAFDVGAPSVEVETSLAEISASAAFASPAPEAIEHPLGAACAQVHETYIVAQTPMSVLSTRSSKQHWSVAASRGKFF